MTAQLRTLLDEAADSRVPADLGERAVAGARRRRTRRGVLVGSMAAVAALAIGVVLIVQPFRTDAEPLPTDVVSLPSELPGPDGLPTLAEAPMDRASAAYTVEGQLVLVSAADGHAAVAVYDLPRASTCPMTWPCRRMVAACWSSTSRLQWSSAECVSRLGRWSSWTSPPGPSCPVG